MKQTWRGKLQERLYWWFRRPASRLRYKALKLVPRPLLYWMAIEAGIRVERNTNPGDLQLTEVLKRLEKKR
jgi:hypothetical protein